MLLIHLFLRKNLMVEIHDNFNRNNRSLTLYIPNSNSDSSRVVLSGETNV